jgi:hypothetical protein
MVHPREDELSFEYAALQANDDPGLELVICAPA